MLDSWLTLYYTPYIGAKRLQQLIQYFGSAKNAVQADNLQWQAAGIPTSVLSHRQKNQQHKVEQALKWMNSCESHTILTFQDESYPPLLKDIHDPPMILFVKGHLPTLLTPQIAIVGARKPTSEGLYNSELFAAELASAGLTITSGLALGVDQAAHQAAVNIQKPTIAVLGTGLNEIYPKSHTKLSQEILLNHGALISEYPLYMPPKPQNFPRRNRIIAGLSLGTLVIEATLKSGSLITARLSMEENREVFTIPGSIHQPQSRGCHQLIREGAVLVESTIDIRTALSGWIETSDSTLQADLFKKEAIAEQQTPAIRSPRTQISTPNTLKSKQALKPIELAQDHPQYTLYQHLKTPKSINQLVELLQQDASTITTDLMLLELEAVITADRGFYQQKQS